MTAAVATRAGERYAHLRVGRCDVAVPALAVVRAMPVPRDGLTGLPRREGALSGLLDFEGGAVPVVALDRWVEVGEAGDTTAARIVVLRAGASLVAIHADALVGIERIDPASVRTVCHHPGDEELFDAVVPATAQRPLLCILEVARLVALAAIWCEDVDLPSRIAGVATSLARAAAATTRYALFMVGDRPFAVPATSIARFAKAPRAELGWPGRRVCGIGTWETRKLPLVDLAAPASAAASPAGTPPAGPKPWMAVLTAGPDAIGLVVSRWERMLDLAADEILPSTADPLLVGSAIVDGLGAVGLLDVGGLFGAVTEATISRVPTPTPAPRPAGSPGAAAPAGGAAPSALDPADGAYLVFEADRRYASPVADVLGVAALPAAAIAELAQGRRTTLEWRGQTVGVVAMPALDRGRTAVEPRVAVVVRGAEAGQANRAIAVQSLRDWLPVHVAQRSGMRWLNVGDLTMITAPGGQRNGSLVVVDLAQMAYLLD